MSFRLPAILSGSPAAAISPRLTRDTQLAPKSSPTPVAEEIVPALIARASPVANSSRPETVPPLVSDMSAMPSVIATPPDAMLPSVSTMVVPVLPVVSMAGAALVRIWPELRMVLSAPLCAMAPSTVAPTPWIRP